MREVWVEQRGRAFWALLELNIGCYGSVNELCRGSARTYRPYWGLRLCTLYTKSKDTPTGM